MLVFIPTFFLLLYALFNWTPCLIWHKNFSQIRQVSLYILTENIFRYTYQNGDFFFLKDDRYSFFYQRPAMFPWVVGSNWSSKRMLLSIPMSRWHLLFSSHSTEHNCSSRLKIKLEILTIYKHWHTDVLYEMYTLHVSEITNKA